MGRTPPALRDRQFWSSRLLLYPRVMVLSTRTLVDTSECDWGRVLAWEPPLRLLVTWQINGSWQYDPDQLRVLAGDGRASRADRRVAPGWPQPLLGQFPHGPGGSFIQLASRR